MRASVSVKLSRTLGIEAAFCRLKDFRRVATRYDKLARNFLSVELRW
jgi:transposase